MGLRTSSPLQVREIITDHAPVIDVVERAVATYVQAVVGLLTAANVGIDELADLSIVKTALVGAIPAGLSVLKSLGAIYVIPGDKSASLMRVGYEKIIHVVERPKTPKKATTVKRVPKESA